MSKVLVISSDATVGEDLDYFQTLESYRRYFSGSSRIYSVSSIYPTVTFPAHATMMTGSYPGRHGIFSNMQLIPGLDPAPWQWNSSFLKCTDIFTEAKKAGLSTSAVMWPVTAGNASIDYHIADYWAQGDGDTTEKAFERAGASKEVLEIVARNKHIFDGVERKHPERDDFCVACACDIIREFKPDLMMIHPANIDAARHENGVFGPHIMKALDRLDGWIMDLGKSLEDAGILDETDIFLVSDHGQMDVRRNIELNVILKERGFIETDENGRIVSWKAYCLSNGMSALIFLSDPSDVELEKSVRKLLDELLEEGLYGFSEIFTTKEADRIYHFSGDFSFVLETDGYTAFGDSVERPLVRPLDNRDYRFGAATHGYLPEKGPQPMLLAVGPDIVENEVFHGDHIVNEAPTYASILGFDIPGADGRPMDYLFRRR